MTSRHAVLAAAFLLSASVLPAQGHQSEQDPMARAVFPPDLVLRHAEEIGLKPEQRTAIVNLAKETQAELFDAQLTMGELHAKLVKELSAKATVDESAVLALMDGVLAAERNIKRRHMQLLIRVKNTLSKEQQDQLQELRKAHESELLESHHLLELRKHLGGPPAAEHHGRSAGHGLWSGHSRVHPTPPPL